MYSILGKVRKGKQRGRVLGFPTANVNLHKIIPHGIYISKTRIKGVLFPSLTFIGNAKTFGESRVQAETFILNFDKQIYNQWILVQLIKKIRENKKFDSIQALRAQMEKDKKEAREYFKQYV